VPPCSFTWITWKRWVRFNLLLGFGWMRWGVAIGLLAVSGAEFSMLFFFLPYGDERFEGGN
jgi:hypothetical protein